MAQGAASTEHFFDGSGVRSIPGVQTNIGVIVGVFDKGKGLMQVASEEEFRSKCGSKPAEHNGKVYWNDYHSVLAFFRNAEVNGRSSGSLWVINVRHYDDPGDITSLTAVHGELNLVDSTDVSTWLIRDKSYRVRSGTVEDSPLSVQVVASPVNPNFVDLIIYENGNQIRRWSNLSADVDAANYVGKVIPSSVDYEVIDLGVGTLPDIMEAPVALTGAVSGLANLDENDFIGFASAAGNAGVRLIDSVLHTESKPTHGMCPYFDAKAYDVTEVPAKQEIIDYFKARNIQPVSGTPTGLDSAKAQDYKNGAGAYDGHTAFTDSTNGALMIWPPYVPVELNGVRDQGQKIFISPAAGKMGLIFAASRREWLHRTAAGTAFGKLRGVAELEVDTGFDDSDRLEPVGLQVIRKDLGNVIDSHQTYSEHPDFKVESVRYRDNYAIHSINLGTRHLLHDNLTEEIMDDVDDMLRNFFYNIFVRYPKAFVYKKFAKSVQTGVRSENVVMSDDWIAGILYTRWNVLWSGAIQHIKHYYSHNRDRSVDLGGGQNNEF